MKDLTKKLTKDLLSNLNYPLSQSKQSIYLVFPGLKSLRGIAYGFAFSFALLGLDSAHAQGSAHHEKTTAAESSTSQSGTSVPTSKSTSEKKESTKRDTKGDKKMNPHVIMETSFGNVEIELFQDKAPLSVANFLKYTDEGFFNGTIFHRVIPNFMIQGGGFTATMDQKKTSDPIKNEANNGLKNEIGTLAMARTNVVDSATSQFFINVSNNEFLNFTAPNPAQYGYAVFGKVVSGMDVVNKIKDVPTGNKGMHQNVPLEPVVIKSMKRK